MWLNGRICQTLSFVQRTCIRDNAPRARQLATQLEPFQDPRQNGCSRGNLPCRRGRIYPLRLNLISKAIKWHSGSSAAECLSSDQGTARKIILYQPYRRSRVEHIPIFKGAIRARSDPT